MVSDQPERMIVRPEPVDVRMVWPTEPRDFTPWLAAHIDWLEIPELGALTVIDTEVCLPETSRALDILAETADGRRVAIENQFAAADHDHLTRGVAYAVGLEAGALVVVAERFASEFVAIADYLNRGAESLGQEEGIAIFLVTLSVERVGEAYYVPRFGVLTRPNQWRSDAQRAAAPRLASAEDLLTRVPEAERGVFAALIEGWSLIPGGIVRHDAARAVALHLRNPRKQSRSTCAVTLHDDGTVSLNRGYLQESGGFSSDADRAELDEVIRRLLPTAQWREKEYYLPVRDPDAKKVLELGTWLSERIVPGP